MVGIASEFNLGDPSTCVGTPVRLYQLHLGDERVVLVVSESSARLLAVCANRLTAALAQVLRRCDFGGPATQCRAMEIVLECGYCMASYSAAEWLTKDVRTLLAIKRQLPNMLSEQAVPLPFIEGADARKADLASGNTTQCPYTSGTARSHDWLAGYYYDPEPDYPADMEKKESGGSE